MTLKELRRNAHSKLQAQPRISSPELDADLIIMYVLDLTKEELLTKDMSVPDALAIEVNAYINRRLGGMPVQYIVGKTEFMSLDFEVNKNTLIPRQDTETLVEAVIDRLKNISEPVKILDIGAGSGCVGISLAKYLPNAFVTELDISEKALKTAERNAEKNMVSRRMSFVCRDIKEGIEDLNSGAPFDVIVSNPPYIPTDDLLELQLEVVEFEPVMALDGGEDGLDFYRLIIETVSPKKGGLLAFEVGYDQAERVADLLHGKGYKGIEIVPDLAGIERVVLGISTN